MHGPFPPQGGNLPCRGADSRYIPLNMQQTENIWNLIHRIGLIAITGMILVGAVMAFTPRVRQMQEYQDTHDSLQQRIEVTLSSEQDLKNKQRRFFSDPEFIEKVAHEVGYAHSDETIFHFPEETGSNGPNL
ncbi:MAG TPA: septum formation initiator family protein [Pontiella sp.]